MKQIIDRDVKLHGKLIRLFKNCPKPSGWFAGKLDDDNLGVVAVSGTCQNLVSVGVVLDMTANLVDSDYGEQYEAYSVSVCVDTQKALLAYLSGPMFPGIGPATAKRLIQAYKDNFTNMLLNYPDTVQKACHLTDKQMLTLKQGVTDSSKENQLLRMYPHFGAAYARQLVQRTAKTQNLFSDALHLLKSNPYLIVEKYDIPFHIVDAVARMDMQIPLTDDRRVRCVFLRAMKKFTSVTKGMYVNLSNSKDTDVLRSEFEKLLCYGIDDNYVSQWIVKLSREGLLHLENYNHEIHLYDQKVWDYELAIMDSCMYHLKGGEYGDKFDEISEQWAMLSKFYLTRLSKEGIVRLCQEQKEAIYGILQHEICCLIGGPGCGKTSVMQDLQRCWENVVGGDVMMLAPTGKAVNRLKEATGFKNIQTIARCLLIHRVKRESGQKGLYPAFDSSQSMLPNSPKTLIIVDEASMVGEEDGARLLRLCSNCHIVLVGDINQLPPVDAGPFFHQLVTSGVIPVMELKENHRVDTPELAENAEKILSGNTKLHLSNHVMMIPGDDATSVDNLIQEYQNYLKNGAEFSDILLMSVVNKGPGSVQDVNMRLQELLNPKSGQTLKSYDNQRGRHFADVKGWEIPRIKCNDMSFRIYDRVMCTKNDAAKSWRKYRYNDPDKEETKMGDGVFNGDTGTIIRYYFGNGLYEPSVMVLMDDGRIVMESQEEFQHFVFGYCITIHKAQGSEAKYCMVLLPERLQTSWWSESYFLTRNLLYTAVTRAREDLWLFGNPAAFANAIKYEQQYHNVMLGTHLNHLATPYLLKKWMAQNVQKGADTVGSEDK